MAAISDPKRKSGISLLGDAPWGTHFCQFYRTKQDLIDILVPYFKAGLENNEFCMWVTSEPLPAEEARAELQKAVKDLAQYDKKGQIEILDFSQWYTRTGKFDAGKVLQGWVDKEQQARKNGFEGLRLTGNTFWIEHKDWKSFSDYEATINDVIHKYNMFALCTYSLEQCDANQILDVFSTHQFALINRNGKWTTIESTEIKGAEEALRESEEQFRLLIQNQGEGIAMADLEERFTFANPAAESIFGVPPGKLVGRRLEDFMTPEQYTGVLEQTWKRNYGERSTYDLEIVRADGERRNLLVTACPRNDPQGRFIGTFGIFRDITERKRAEEALNKSNRLLRDTGEMAQVGGWVLDLLTKEVFLTEEVCRIHGVEPGYQPELEEALNFYAPESRPEVEAVVKKAAETGEPYDLKSLFIPRGSKGQIWVRSLGKAVYSGGKIVKLVGTFQNIDKYERAEEALRESEARYRTLVENIPQKIFMKDRSFRWVSVNENLARDLGIRPEEVVGKVDCDFFPKELADKYRADDVRIMETGKTEVLEEKYLQEGKEVWVNTVKTPVRDSHGEIIGVFGIFWDITERKRAEDSLRQSEERFRVLFEQAADIILLMEITPRGIPVIQDANSATSKLLGYERDELIGQPVSIIEAAPDASKVVEERREEVLSASGRKIFEAKHRCKDGTVREFECSVTEMQIGSKTFAISVERDITERRSLEAQLLQAQKLESVGLLAGGIAHEFNNILGGILGYASLMRLKMEPDHPFWGYVETIEKSSQRAALLTSQLLGFARKGKYDLRLLNLNLLAEDTLAIVRQTFDRAVKVEDRLAESLPKVEGDTMQLQQVLMNLCINARDAMPKGGSLVLTTGTEQVAEGDERIPPESKPGLYVLLSVADTGCGMDEETQAKIFQPFFTTKEKGKGTGLGLAMVYGVVKNHGGFVTVRSEVGRGSAFTLHLPAAEKPSERKPEVLAVPEKSRGAVPDQTILVVDDEESIRYLARDILEGEGYRVLLAEDGARALEAYREHQGEIGLVVLDLIMPKLGGGEVFLKMKEMDPGVHVLVSSGYSQEGKAQEILSGGALGFVQKPFHVRDLISQVRQGLDGGGIH